MTDRILLNFGSLVVISALMACGQGRPRKETVDPTEFKKPLIKANQQLVDSENQDIDLYLKRHNWVMTETGSGLRYRIYEAGSGKPVRKGMVVRCAFTTGLLTGKVCYTSEEQSPKEFQVGNGGVESGLEEAVLLLREGDRAKIILPSHLAFGLLGDDDCIPKRAALVYDLEVLAVLDPFRFNE